MQHEPRSGELWIAGGWSEAEPPDQGSADKEPS
jgi:hypothetical protein